MKILIRKIDIINDDVKDTMIKQTIESAQNQQEGTGIQQDQDMTSIVSDIIVNSNTETGSKMIEELNNSATDKDNDLSLKIISDISEKDTKEQVKKELTLLFMKTVLKSSDVKKVKTLLNTSDEMKRTLKKTFNSL